MGEEGGEDVEVRKWGVRRVGDSSGYLRGGDDDRWVVGGAIDETGEEV